MTAQINLYDKSLSKPGELLTLTKVVGVAFVLYTLLGGAAAWFWYQATAQKAEVIRIAAETKAIKAEFDERNRGTGAKPSPQLVAELENVQAQLRRREETARSLEVAFAVSQGGFSEYFRSLARQIPEGLWLTGVTVGAAGNDLEVRGSLVNTAALPEYIHRLGGESSFRGRTFAALTMNRITSLPSVPASESVPGPAPTVKPAAASSGAFVGVAPPPVPKTNDQPVLIDFVLVPKATNGAATDSKGGLRR